MGKKGKFKMNSKKPDFHKQSRLLKEAQQALEKKLANLQAKNKAIYDEEVEKRNKLKPSEFVIDPKLCFAVTSHGQCKSKPSSKKKLNDNLNWYKGYCDHHNKNRPIKQMQELTHNEYKNLGNTNFYILLKAKQGDLPEKIRETERRIREVEKKWVEVWTQEIATSDAWFAERRRKHDEYWKKREELHQKEQEEVSKQIEAELKNRSTNY